MKIPEILKVLKHKPHLKTAISKAVQKVFRRYRLKFVPILVTCTILVPNDDKQKVALAKVVDTENQIEQDDLDMARKVLEKNISLSADQSA